MDAQETKSTEKIDLKEILEKQLCLLHEHSVEYGRSMGYAELAEISRAMCTIVETINKHYYLAP